MKVSVIFDSQKDFEAMGARLGPILDEMGIDPGTPDIIEVHNIIRRGE
jgi:hypothetical protein